MATAEYNARQVNSTITNLYGLQKLVTSDGTDIIKLVKDIKKLAEDLKSAQATQSAPKLDMAEIRKMIEELVDTEDFRGPSGPVGPAGPAGPKGRSIDKLQDLKDVNCDGLTDGCVPVYRGGVWKVEHLDSGTNKHAPHVYNCKLACGQFIK